jgi:outer membrane lipoprotein-sorting protein
MNRSPFLTSLLVAALVPTALFAQTDGRSAIDVLESAATRYTGIHTLCADFHQLLQVTLLGREREGTGELCQQAPNLFSMRFTDPEGDAIVVDGEFLWLYTPSNDPGQVLRTAAESADGRFNFHRTFLDDPASKFRAIDEGAEEVLGRSAHRIRVEPMAPTGFTSARVWIDSETQLLVRLSIEDLNESIRTVTLSNQRIDPLLTDDTFRFEPPPGTRVVQR